MILPLSLLVVEDNVIIADDLKLMLEDRGYTVAAMAMSYEEAVEALEYHTIDMALIDIRLATKKTGIDLSHYIREHHKIPFIYITSHADKDTINQAKETAPYGYLVKPFDKNQLFATIEVASARFNNTKHPDRTENSHFTDSIFIKENNLYHRLLITDIIFIKADNNYVDVHTTSRKYTDRAPLKHYIQKLPATHFIRTHKSYIVNKNYIEVINTKEIVIAGNKLPLSRESKDRLMNIISK